MGVWTVFPEDETVSSLDCEVCEKWEFKDDQTLVIKKVNGELEIKVWKIDSQDSLWISEMSKGECLNNFNSELTALFSKSGTFQELRLKYNGKVLRSVLRKITNYR